jgi:hypothetical protein
VVCSCYAALGVSKKVLKNPAHGASFSKAIAKIGNAELAHFTKQMFIHELIRVSLIAATGPG